MALNRGNVAQTETTDAPAMDMDQGILTEAPPVLHEVAVVEQPEAVTDGPKDGPWEKGMEDSGFEGLEIGRFSYTAIALDGAKFIDQDKTDLGVEFKGIVLGTKKKWVMNNTRTDRDTDKVGVFSYDKIHEANSGELMTDIISDWKERGWGHTWKPYLDVQVMVIEGAEEIAGEPVILSIPPTGIQRISGVIKRAGMKHHLKPSEFVMCFYVGEEKQNAAKQTFYPWNFEFDRKAAPDEMNFE